MEKTKEQTCLRRRDLLTNFVVLPREKLLSPRQPIGRRFLIPLRATPSWFWVGSELPPQNFGSTCLQVSLRMTHKFFMKHNFFIPDRRGRV